jgi:hypothetical protein
MQGIGILYLQPDVGDGGVFSNISDIFSPICVRQASFVTVNGPVRHRYGAFLANLAGILEPGPIY